MDQVRFHLQHLQQLGAFSDVQHEEAPSLQQPASIQQAGMVFPWQHSGLVSPWQYSGFFSPLQQLFSWEGILFWSNFLNNYRHCTLFPFKWQNYSSLFVFYLSIEQKTVISNQFNVFLSKKHDNIKIFVQFFSLEIIKIHQNNEILTEKLIKCQWIQTSNESQHF